MQCPLLCILFHMRHWLLILLFLCFSISRVCASIFLDDSSIGIGGGYRIDHFNWNIGGPKGFPNILSELSWERLKIWQVDACAKLLTYQHIYGRVNADYGWINKGYCWDSDFLGNNRQKEFARSISCVNRGHVYDLSAGLGYQFSDHQGILKFSPLIGYSYHAQDFVMMNGYFLLNRHDPINGIGSIHGLNSTYRACWHGLWLGGDVACQVACFLTLFATYEYHWSCYRAHGYWNLRPELPHGFFHRANGHGHIVRLEARYGFGDGRFISAEGYYQTWQAEKGRDITPLLRDNSLMVEICSPLNRVQWNSLVFVLRVGFLF